MRAKRLACLLLAAALALLAGCSGPAASSQAESGPQRYTAIYYDVFDTMTQLIAYCDSEEEFQRQSEALHADLLAYHRLYDIYNSYEGLTNLADLNSQAGAGPVQVDARILDLLELSAEMYELTGGRLNVAMGSVLQVWHNYREAAQETPEEADNALPTQAELEAAAQHCDIQNMVLDREAGTVALTDPAMSLDVGSIGKGYAVEMACRAAEERGLTSALLSVGGNLRAIGSKPDGASWVGGVTDPWDAPDVYTVSSSTVDAVRMDGMALVTSGNYQRYYLVDGQRYHHLIDPATLWPAAYFDSVSVLCADSGLADALTTGLSCSTLEEGLALVESLEGVEALWCTPDGQVVASSGWSSYSTQ